MTGLNSLNNLTCLSLQSNRLKQIEGLEDLKNLDELYLSENMITKIENLNNNIKLQTLDVAQNKVQVIDNVAHLAELQELWLNDNHIGDWSSIEKLTANTKLATIYLERNPLATDPAYRRKITLSLPWLTQIDATLCQRH